MYMDFSNFKFRVINVLKKWVENHVHDFSLDVDFIKKFVVFLDEVVASDNHKWAEHLKKIVEARILKSIVCILLLLLLLFLFFFLVHLSD